MSGDLLGDTALAAVEVSGRGCTKAVAGDTALSMLSAIRSS